MIKENYEKMCSFYVSKNHLIVMLMSYLKNKLDEQIKLTLIMEDNFEKEINTIINKVEMKEITSNKILEEYKRKNKRKLNKRLSGIVIVQGSYEYIEKVNNILKKNMKIKLINCYKFEDFELNSRSILEAHNKILNTLGEHTISDIFNKHSTEGTILTK